MRGTAPPDDFELFIYPRYILRYQGTISVKLTPNMGELLSILMGSSGVNLTVSEIEGIFYAGERIRDIEWMRNAIYAAMYHLKKRLLSRGFVLKIAPDPGRCGYRFMGFDVIDPKPEQPKTTKRKARQGKPIADLKKLNKNLPIPAPPKVLPPAYAAAQNAPWHFPARLEFSREK
jgi:hypothetical protein